MVGFQVVAVAHMNNLKGFSAEFGAQVSWNVNEARGAKNSQVAKISLGVSESLKGHDEVECPCATAVEHVVSHLNAVMLESDGKFTYEEYRMSRLENGFVFPFCHVVLVWSEDGRQLSMNTRYGPMVLKVGRHVLTTTIGA